MTKTLEAIKYKRGDLKILDQLKLPHESTYVPIKDSEDGFQAIKDMVVRGAPAIAIVAALSLAVELCSNPQDGATPAEARNFVHSKLDYLRKSRPTAVNLADAAMRLKEVVSAEVTAGKEVFARYIQAAEQMLVDDVQDNKNIGDFGARWILENVTTADGRIKVLTHCNTGSLATAGYGTALGIIRSLHLNSNLEHAYYTETRPYNQGSRLTAYELVYENIPATLITDSMAASLMRLKGVAAVIVGADRVAQNGDTANKIGTYQLAIVAKHHGVKFVVAAPTTSIDMNTASGDGIEIEHRPGVEVLVSQGPTVGIIDGKVQLDESRFYTISTAAHGINVYNPSFDVTPNDLIDAIVTEKGVAVRGLDGKLDLSKFFS